MIGNWGYSDERPLLWQDGKIYHIKDITENFDSTSYFELIKINNNGYILADTEINGKRRAVILKPI